MLPRPISQYQSEPIGINIFNNSQPFDPDNNDVSVKVINTDNNTTVVPLTQATRESTGVYSYQLESGETSILGNYQAVWSYTVNTTPRIAVDNYQVVETMQWWDQLTLPERQIVVNVYSRVSNSWDSTSGGPYLATLLQSSFNAYEVIARIAQTEALSYFNFERQPAFFSNPFGFSATSTNVIPAPIYGLYEEGVYVSFLRHLSRSYIEQPTPQGLDIPFDLRRDYRDRWQQEWETEKAIYDRMLAMFKRNYLVGSDRSMAVAGGIYAYGFPFKDPASQPRWFYMTANFTATPSMSTMSPSA